jgi:hypothetical protein
MSFRSVDIESALRRLADKRIEDAMQEGKFDNLPGAGQPLNLDPMPAEENARMTWWALRILRNNSYTPDEIRWRKAIDHLKARLNTTQDESDIAPTVKKVNELVRQLNTLGTNALKQDIAPHVDAEELQRFRELMTSR